MKFSRQSTMEIKGVAILLMFFHHCFMNRERWATVPFEQLAGAKDLSYFPISFFPFSENSIVYAASFFKICVGMFVFLTGYGMMAAYDAKKRKDGFSITSYIKQRYIKLMKGFLLIFVMVQILSIPTGRFSIIYGHGLKAILYFFLDALGLGKLLHTPMFCLTWWYMSLALMLILIFPLVSRGIEKYTWLFVIAAFLLPRALELNIHLDLLRYMLAYTLGIIFYKKHLLVKIKKKLLSGGFINQALKFVLVLLGLMLLVKCRQNAWIGEPFYDFWDGVSPAYLIILSYTYILEIKPLNKILGLLGEHSMNMFLIHSFYRDIFFHEFIYSFHSIWCIYSVLLIISLASSFILEWIKNKLMIITHLCRRK